MSEWMAYLQFLLGATRDASGRAISDTSWSAQLQGSERLWMLLEGAHVLTLMLFAGTIFFVDLRLVGATLRTTPVSKVTDSVLPYTVVGFGLMVVTGVALFFSSPFDYFHNFVFRLKIAFLIAAAINIFVFHYRVQTNRPRWDAQQRPPAGVRAAAVLSLTLWLAVIVAGRYVAYDWVKCEHASGWIAAAAQCPERDATLARFQARIAP